MKIARLAAAGLLVCLGGCLVAGSSEEKVSGHYVSDETLGRIEPGKTTPGWLVATLGEPDKKTKVEGCAGAEVWKWTYTEKKESSTAVFLIFGGSSKKERVGAVMAEVRGGEVVRVWRG